MRVTRNSFPFYKDSELPLELQIEIDKDNGGFEESASKELVNRKSFSDEVLHFLKTVENKIKPVDKKLFTKSFLEYTKTPTEADKFITHLMKPLKRLSKEDELTLFYFLQAAISYTIKTSPEEECNLENLVFLAIMLRDDTTKKEYTDSLFDFFIKGHLEENTNQNNSDLILYYDRFCVCKNENTPGMILKNVLKISLKFTPYKLE